MTVQKRKLLLKRVLKVLVVDALACFVPPSVYILHIAVETAEFGQELGLVKVSLAILHVGLDAWFLVEPSIRVVFGAI